MRNKYSEFVEVPSEVNFEISNKIITIRKGAKEAKKKVNCPSISLRKEGNKLLLESPGANKNEIKIIKAYLAHIHNMIKGLEQDYIYQLQACNVHFPMTLKVDKDSLLINNFLGEKKPRIAKIIPGVKVDIKGQAITLTSHDKESAGQTAANIEKATRVKNRDRRVFQDGIYIVEKPGRQG